MVGKSDFKENPKPDLDLDLGFINKLGLSYAKPSLTFGLDIDKQEYCSLSISCGELRLKSVK